MQQAIDLCKTNIQSIKQLDTIYLYLKDNEVKTLDLSEILRSEIVLAVSALDNFISDVLYYGILEIFEGNKVLPIDLKKPYNDFQFSMEILSAVSMTSNLDDKKLLLGNYIRKINSKKPYQDPKQIESALVILGIKQIWTKLGTELSMQPEDVKRELANIVWQRHKIAHEADIDPTTQNKRNRDRESTIKAIEFIEKLCKSIHKIVFE
jgi:hypothetical protein